MTYDCCEHCKHDINDPAHDRPCIVEGCEEARERDAREYERYVNGDCGYGVVPEEWHHGVAGPPMTDAPADRCER